jgi:hypothetical protein
LGHRGVHPFIAPGGAGRRSRTVDASGAGPTSADRVPRLPESAPAAPPADGARPPARPVELPRPQANRDLASLKRQAADRILAANPTLAHRGPIQEPLLAIPVLEIELERDGGIRRIVVLRHPRQARDTTEIAIAAVRRAAPFGDVSALRRPWVFSETFLFGDDRTFKVRTHHE